MIDIASALQEYDDHQLVYQRLKNRTVDLLNDLFVDARLGVHSVNPRVKTRESLSEKLGRDGKHYQSLSDVTDIVGLRVITYFEDELEVVDRLITRNFEIDELNSSDRKDQLKTNQFGYRSVHYVCGYPEERLKLGGNEIFRGFKIEIQARSILQHAWAEIEHEFYKSKGPKPDGIERRNSRLAGLLEIADAEFVAIRREMERYQRNIDLRVGTEDKNLSDVKIDSVSLTSFLQNETQVQKVNKAVAKASGAALQSTLSEANVAQTLKMLYSAGFSTLEQLRESLKLYAPALPGFSAEVYRSWIADSGSTPSLVVQPSSALRQMAILRAAIRGEEDLYQLHVFSTGDDSAYAPWRAAAKFQLELAPKYKDKYPKLT